MPGKYSHSVVLADYSSRGVIVLPPDQRVKYANSAPQNRGPSAASMRLRGTRSAQTMYRPPTSTREGWNTLTLDRPHPSLSTSTTPTRARVNVSIDDDQESFRPLRYSGYYDQMPHSTPAVNVVTVSPPPPLPQPRSAYERQQLRNDTRTFPVPNTLSSSNQASGSGAKQKFLTPEEQLIHPAMRNSNSNVSLRKDAVASRQSPYLKYDNRESNRSSSSETLASFPHPASRKQNMADVDLSSQNKNSKEGIEHVVAGSSANRDRLVKPETWKRLPQLPTQTEKEPQQRKLKEQAKISQKRLEPNRTENTDSNKQERSKHTEVQSQNSKVDDEPNFDGFSDGDQIPASYFEVPKQQPSHVRDSSENFTLPIQRPEPQIDAKLLNQRDDTAAFIPGQGASIRDGRSTPSGTARPSTIGSPNERRSNSSVLSASLLNGYSQGATSSKKETSIDSAHPSSPEQKWGLPEIQEDNGFSPSIFEDNEGEAGKFSLEDFDMLGSIGQISSGKDVSLDNDAASELSAALPPPISRFKDDEDEFNANMMRFFGDGGDVVTKKSSGTFNRWPSAKKSFFSKFRSKS